MNWEPPQNRYGGKSAAERRALRREKLLAAGLELHGTEGYAAASIERICELAGLSTRQFYEEFDHRDQVLIDLYDEVNDRTTAAVTEVVTRALEEQPRIDIRELIRRTLETYIKITTDDPRWAQLVYATIVGVNPQIEQHRQEHLNAIATRLCELADDCADRGYIPRQDFGLTMRAFTGAVHGLVHDWCQSDPRPPLEDVTETLTHMLFSTVSTAPV